MIDPSHLTSFFYLITTNNYTTREFPNRTGSSAENAGRDNFRLGLLLQYHLHPIQEWHVIWNMGHDSLWKQGFPKTLFVFDLVLHEQGQRLFLIPELFK